MNKYEALDEFEKGNKIRWTTSTLRHYKQCIKRFFDFYPNILNIEDFEPEHVEGWLIYLNDERKLKSTSRRFYFDSLKAFYVYFNEETEISVNPTIGVDKPSPICGILPVVDRFSMFQLREVMKVNPRDRAILETLYATGVRVQELCDIQIQHLHKADRQLEIPKGKDEKPRIVLFTPFCLEWINSHLKTRHDDNPFLFTTRLNGPFCTKGIWTLLNDYSKLAQLSNKINPHAFRRTFATILYKNGVSIEKISRLMGHANLRTTQRYIIIDYTQLV